MHVTVIPTHPRCAQTHGGKWWRDTTRLTLRCPQARGHLHQHPHTHRCTHSTNRHKQVRTYSGANTGIGKHIAHENAQACVPRIHIHTRAGTHRYVHTRTQAHMHSKAHTHTYMHVGTLQLSCPHPPRGAGRPPSTVLSAGCAQPFTGSN